jgi:hypothetical protein
MLRNRKTLMIALAVTVGLGGAAYGASEPFADLDNDGVFGQGDVPIGKLINNDGQFSTDKAEGAYKPQAGPVGVVFPDRFVGKKRAAVVKASGDITVHGDINVPGQGGVIFLLSTGGSVHIADGLRFQTDSIMQFIALEDIKVGSNVEMRSKSNQFAMVALTSQSGDVAVGDEANIGAAGLVELSTGQETGGSVTVGRGSRVASGSGSARVTAGDEVSIEDVRVTGRNVIIGSHGSSRAARSAGGAGPGYASVRNCQIRGNGGDASVRIFAEGGDGSTIDITRTKVQVKDRDALNLDADVIVR